MNENVNEYQVEPGSFHYTSRSSVNPVTRRSETIRNNSLFRGVLIVLGIIAIIAIIVGVVHNVADKDTDTDNDNVSYESSYDTTVEVEDEIEETTEYVPSYNTISVNEISNKSLSTDDVEFIYYSDSIDSDDEIDSYSFIPIRSGTYRIDFSEVYSGVDFDVFVYDSLGEQISCNYGCGNNEGLTVYLEDNEEYTISIEESGGYSSYDMTIGQQKKKIDITDYTTIYDSIEFNDQINKYNFVAPIDGIYRFDFSEIYNNINFDVFIYNHLGEQVGCNYGRSNGEGITICMEKGENYSLTVEESGGFSTYTLDIGYPHKSNEIGSFYTINDSISFTDQCNTYHFSCNDENEHSFVIDGMTDCVVDVFVYNEYGEQIDCNYGCSNGDGVTVYDKCKIEINERQGFSKYIVTVE